MDFDFSFLDTFSPVGNTEFSLAGMSQDFPEIATSEGMFELASNQLAAPTDVQQHNSASSSISSHTQIEFDPFETEHFSSWNAVSPSTLSFNHTTDVYPALSSLQYLVIIRCKYPMNDVATTPSTPSSSSHRVSKQRQRSSHSQYARSATIGVVLDTDQPGQNQYKCNAPTCFNKTFGRLAELKRHHKCKHAVAGRRPQFWCPVEGCVRSKTGQGGAFPRKDKMVDHLSKVHASVVQG
ncbi:hypothetical protein HBI04_057460 [Parastagonospora nodorum]|nr:hypothetical protein HBH54_159960 [Parastagonospora nodorum]KAH4144480.1 hypothetical protein HBH45_025730 [Parastagonospora nodorum]KAH4158959.1 hypothetical protein HBH44_111390 [Parastagonospora nodorum]KAH4269450.1 hypothetical protein HBI03_049810 [Parastagonospora nodorum]KAH4280203.1 hypothetical protein HBI04_057460 [Parastagonospora nodorum]